MSNLAAASICNIVGLPINLTFVAALQRLQRYPKEILHVQEIAAIVEPRKASAPSLAAVGRLRPGCCHAVGRPARASRRCTTASQPDRAASDTQAMGVLKAARERRLQVPKDLAVMGFDDLEIADYIGLTTISQALDESGRIAIELLLARLADPLRAVQHVRLPLNIIQRQTT